MRSAVLTVFRAKVSHEGIAQVVDSFDEETQLNTGEDIADAEFVAMVAAMPALAGPVAELVGDDTSPASVASAVEFILEGLHLSKRLNKDSLGTRSSYRSR
ncbi:MAG: hypothetical protein R2706_15035 [Acidimicrobiales bacterium]